jgi:hypothetical protein
MTCLPASDMLGMRVSSQRSLDLLTGDGWYRAFLEEGCDARQFYSGFYVRKADNGLFCSDREELHARSGMTCRVARLTAL